MDNEKAIRKLNRGPKNVNISNRSHLMGIIKIIVEVLWKMIMN